MFLPPRGELLGDEDVDFKSKMTPTKDYIQDLKCNAPMIHHSKACLILILQAQMIKTFTTKMILQQISKLMDMQHKEKRRTSNHNFETPMME